MNRTAEAAGRVCWGDAAWDRAYASDRRSRYGAYLADHAKLFDPFKDAPDGITSDPVEFAIAAFHVATGAIMSPGYLRWHGRVCDHQLGRSEHDGRLLVSVTLASSPPARLPWSWSGWDRQLDGSWREPEDRRPVALGRLELRWPVPTEQLPQPARPRVAGRPNLADARRAVAILVHVVNATAGPVLGALEVGR